MQKIGKGLNTFGRTLTTKVTAPIVAGLGLAVLAMDKQLKAEAQLNAALAATGQLTGDTFQEMLDFAASLQKVTTVGDETTIQLLQVATTMGLNAESAKRAAQNAIGLSKGMGIAEKSAIRYTAALESGDTTMLNRYIPTLRLIEDDTERAAEAQKLLADMFGVAKAEAQTGLGPLRQAWNEFGDSLEEVGKALQPVIAQMAEGIRAIADAIKDASPEARVMGVAILGVVAAVGPLALALGVGAGGLAFALSALVPLMAAVLPPLLAIGAGLAAGALAAEGLVGIFEGVKVVLKDLAERFILKAATAINSLTLAWLEIRVAMAAAQSDFKEVIKLTKQVGDVKAAQEAIANLAEIGEVGGTSLVDGFLAGFEEGQGRIRQGFADVLDIAKTEFAAGARGLAGLVMPSAPAGGGGGPEAPVSTRPGLFGPEVSTEAAPIFTAQAIAAERLAAAIAVIGEAGTTTQAALAKLDPGTAAFAEGQEQLQFLADTMADLAPESAEAFQAVADNARVEMARAGNAATSMIEQMSVGLSDWAEESAVTLETWGELAAETFDQFKQGVGDAIAVAIVEGENLTTAMQGVLKSIAQSVISTLIQLGIQQLANLALSLVVNAGAGASGVGVAAAQTWANAFAATAAIPIVGPALAPEVATAALAAMLAGVSAASASGAAAGGAAAGGAAGGLENVPETGTFILHRNERVLSQGQNESLMAMLDTALIGGGEGPLGVQVQIAGPVVFDDIDLADFDRHIEGAVARGRKRRRL